jgi:arylsulfatase A-like enzyme
MNMGSKTGFGPMQIRLALLGFALLATGLFLAMPAGRRRVQQWRAPSAMAEQPLQPASLLLIAAWFALFTGLIEACILADKKFSFHQFIFLSPHFAWMTPLAALLIFGVAAFFLSLVVWRRPGLISLRSAVFILAFLCFLNLLFMATWLHRLAALVLAAGLAAQTARIIGAHGQRFYWLVRRTTLWMATIVVGLAVGVYGWQEVTERRAVATLPPAVSDAPNVLLIVLDTVRARSLSLYGYDRPTTPQLERFSKKGVVFERAHATAPWTLPSHASMFTGRFPYELGLSASFEKPLDSTYPTLAELFKERGYVTSGFSANLGYCSYESGLSRGFIHFEDYPVSLKQIISSSSLYRAITNSNNLVREVGATRHRRGAAEINGSFLRWLSSKDERPFFAFLNYFDAHLPYLPPKPFDTKFGPQKTELDAYESCIAYIDHQVGLLLDELEKRDLFENTLIIITSDHGEQFGEHNLFGHGNSLYLPLLHVPLLVSFPDRVPAGKSVKEAVTLRDIPATVVDLLKLEDVAQFPGNSLARHWDGTDGSGGAVADAPLSEERRMKSLIVDRYHYIVNKQGREELYDIEKDPFEEQNLADSEEGRRACERFRTSLETILVFNRTSD